VMTADRNYTDKTKARAIGSSFFYDYDRLYL